MKKNILTFTITLASFCLFAQVGIKTNTPQQGVHVAGGSSSVKIDGLSYPYNPNNLGPGNVSRVFVNADGDLVLSSAQNNLEVLFSTENYLADNPSPSWNLVTQHGYGDGFTFAGSPRDIPNSTFTLLKPAILEINYAVSWHIEKNATTRISDGHARVVQTLLYFRKNNYTGAIVTTDLEGNLIGGNFEIDGSTSSIGGGLGISGTYYTNNDSSIGETDNFQITGTDYVKLPPGTYCPMFSAQLAVADASSSGAMKLYLGSGNDEVQIIAHYYD